MPVLFLVLLADEGARAERPVIRVAAASSLAFAFDDIARSFEERTGARVVVSIGSTGLLARQIEYGAPFDVFFAADVASVGELAGRGLVIPESVERYAEGRLVVAVNRASGVEAGGLEDLAGPMVTRVAIANPDHAPYGAAAREALKRAGVWEDVRAKLVYGENIRQTLQFVQTGNAQVGIVALSVADVPEVASFPVDPSLHDPIYQAAAVVSASERPGLARDFIRYIKGPEGGAVMRGHGFFPPGESE